MPAHSSRLPETLGPVREIAADLAALLVDQQIEQPRKTRLLDPPRDLLRHRGFAAGRVTLVEHARLGADQRVHLAKKPVGERSVDQRQDDEYGNADPYQVAQRVEKKISPKNPAQVHRAYTPRHAPF